MHDPRVGRFFAVDPLAKKYPYNSVYAFSENEVIDAVELEGLEKYKTEDGKDIGQVGDDQSTRIMKGVYSGTKEAKKVSTAIKIVNEISSKINRDLQNKPEAAASEYLNNPKTKDLLKIHNRLETELFNGSESLLSYKFKKMLNIEIGTSQFWSDGPSNYSSEDLGDGKVSFELPDMDLFILISFYKTTASAFKNTQIKIFKTDKDLYTAIYKTSMKTKHIVKGVEKIQKVSKNILEKKLDENYAKTVKKPFSFDFYHKGKPVGGGADNFKSLKEANKWRDSLIKNDVGIDSIVIKPYK